MQGGQLVLERRYCYGMEVYVDKVNDKGRVQTPSVLDSLLVILKLLLFMILPMAPIKFPHARSFLRVECPAQRVQALKESQCLLRVMKLIAHSLHQMLSVSVMEYGECR